MHQMCTTSTKRQLLTRGLKGTALGPLAVYVTEAGAGLGSTSSSSRNVTFKNAENRLQCNHSVNEILYHFYFYEIRCMAGYRLLSGHQMSSKANLRLFQNLDASIIARDVHLPFRNGFCNNECFIFLIRLVAYLWNVNGEKKKKNAGSEPKIFQSRHHFTMEKIPFDITFRYFSFLPKIALSKG